MRSKKKLIVIVILFLKTDYVLQQRRICLRVSGRFVSRIRFRRCRWTLYSVNYKHNIFCTSVDFEADIFVITQIILTHPSVGDDRPENVENIRVESFVSYKVLYIIPPPFFRIARSMTLNTHSLLYCLMFFANPTDIHHTLTVVPSKHIFKVSTHYPEAKFICIMILLLPILSQLDNSSRSPLALQV